LPTTTAAFLIVLAFIGVAGTILVALGIRRL